MELVQIYLKTLNKLAVIGNFLAFFLFLFDKFSLLDPDPCGFGSTALRVANLLKLSADLLHLVHEDQLGLVVFSMQLQPRQPTTFSSHKLPQKRLCSIRGLHFS